MEHIELSRIVVTRVSAAQRIEFLPRHFGLQMLTVERAVYGYLENLCADYRGGYWDFLELSNGGCYLTPSGSRSYRILVEENGFCTHLGGHRLGIAGEAARRRPGF